MQNKLMELGWSSGGLDDTSLAEYVVLMLVNGQTEDEVATSLTNDILGELGAEGTSASDFARWLFQQIAILSGQPVAQSEMLQPEARQQTQQQQDSPAPDSGGEQQDMGMNDDAEMNDSGDAPQDGSMYARRWPYIPIPTNPHDRPTGPKNLRGGRTRGQRMLGHMNRQLQGGNDRAMHRIKGAAGGAGRINSHAREPPSGPSGPSGPAPRGPRATMQRLGNATPQRQMQQMQQQMNPNDPNNPLGQMTPQQQMQLFAMYEQQAKMMAQIFNPGQQGQSPQQAGLNGAQQHGHSKSLFDRVDARGSRSQNNRPAQNHIASADSSMDVEASSSQPQSKQDASTTTCRFNLSCSKPDCPFVHQSPAAPPGTTIDTTDTCSFGASCKNRKCTGKHPSPAQAGPMGHALSSGRQPNTGSGSGLASAPMLGGGGVDADCKFYPHCTNPSCPFRHPTMPPCRNGADCTTPSCKFFHNKTACKFDPCLNPSCPYKHAEGQKRGSYRDKVWIAPGSEDGEGGHVSERKFIEGEGDEELIRPDGQPGHDAEQESGDGTQAMEAQAAQPEGIVT